MKKKVSSVKKVMKVMESVGIIPMREAVSKEIYINQSGSGDNSFQAVKIVPGINKPNKNNHVMEGPKGTLKEVLLYLKSKYPYDKYELHAYGDAWAGNKYKTVGL